MEKEVNELIAIPKNSIKTTRNISKNKIKPDTSREMIRNRSTNARTNPEPKKVIKKPSFKISNQYFVKVLLN